MIQKIDVTGIAAFEYLSNQLELGGKSLSRLISLLQLKEGKIYSFAPKHTSKKSLFEFNKGGIYSLTKKNIFENGLIAIRNDSKKIILNLLYEYINKNNDNLCIFEEPNAIPSDKWISNSKMEYAFLGNEIYYLFQKSNNKVDLEKAFKTSEGYYFLCVLSTVKSYNRPQFLIKKEINSNLLSEIVENLSCFFIRAYDGEGYLMWSKE